MPAKLAPFIADHRLLVPEARAFQKQIEADLKGAKGAPPAPAGAVTADAKAQAAQALKDEAAKTLFMTPSAHKLIELIANAPVAPGEVKPPKPIDPTHRTKLFKTDDAIHLELDADFDKLFAEKEGAGEDPGEPGTLVVGEGADAKKIPVNVRTRGQSSLQTLPEPKLRIKLDKAARAGTDFEKEGSLEIGVQGGKGGKDELGRVLIPEAPPREAATYALLESMGLTVPRTKVANFDYKNAAGAVRSQPAFLCEASDTLAKRFFGDTAKEVSEGTDAPVAVTLKTEDVLRMNMGLLLVGNRDWEFPTDGDNSQPTVTISSGLHNTKLIFDADPINPHGLPVATDYDLSLFVLQGEYGGYWKNHPAGPNMPIDYAAELKTMHQQFPSPQFDEVVKDVLSRQKAMTDRLDKYPLDDASKKFIRTQVDAFMTAAANELAGVVPAPAPAAVAPAAVAPAVVAPAPAAAPAVPAPAAPAAPAAVAPVVVKPVVVKPVVVKPVVVKPVVVKPVVVKPVVVAPVLVAPVVVAPPRPAAPAVPAPAAPKAPAPVKV